MLVHVVVDCINACGHVISSLYLYFIDTMEVGDEIIRCSLHGIDLLLKC